MRTAAFTIAGWGVVGDEYAWTSATSDGDTITVDVPAGVASNFADEIGADIRLLNSAVFPATYTLLGVTTSTLLLADSAGAVARADVSAGTVCVEDPYRLCTEIPDYVSGQNAAARWFRLIADIPPTLGASIPRTGGVGVVDSIRVKTLADTTNAALRQLLRIAPDPLTEDGIVITLAEPISDTDRRCELRDAVSLEAGFYVLHIDEEAVSVFAPATQQYTTLFIRRGVLGTRPAPHAAQSILWKSAQTYIGARCSLESHAVNATSKESPLLRFDGVLDAPSYDDGTAAVTFPVRSELINAYAGGVQSRVAATAKWSGIDVIIRQRDPFQTWRWVAIGGLAWRLIPTPVFTEDPTSGEVGRRYLLDLWRGPSNPVIIDPTIAVEEALFWLGYTDPAAYSRAYEYVPEAALYDYVFRALTIDATQLVALGEPEPCVVLSVDPRTYVNAPYSSLDPNQLMSRGFAVADPVGAIVAVLCSTGTGNNTGPLDVPFGGYFGTVDYLPAYIGLAIPQTRLDVDTFLPGAIGRPLPEIGGLVMSAEDSRDPAKWLEEKILRPLHLALTTRKSGKIALVDLASLPDLEDAISLDLASDTRITNGGTQPEVSTRFDIAGIVSGVRVTWHRAAALPSFVQGGAGGVVLGGMSRVSQATQVAVVVRGDIGEAGRSRVMDRIAGGALECEPGWIVDGDGMVDAIQQSAGAFLAQQGIPRLAIDATVTEANDPGDIELGDLVALSNAPIPGADGTRGITEYARVYGIQRNVLSGTQRISMLVIGRAPNVTRWVASGIVTSAATTTRIGIQRNAFAVTGGRAETDASAFRVGDAVLLLSPTFELRNTSNVPEITGIDLDADTLTIDVAFSDGAPITPDEGDLIIVAKRQDQSAQSIARRGWLDYGQAGLTTSERSRWR